MAVSMEGVLRAQPINATDATSVLDLELCRFGGPATADRASEEFKILNEARCASCEGRLVLLFQICTVGNEHLKEVCYIGLCASIFRTVLNERPEETFCSIMRSECWYFRRIKYPSGAWPKLPATQERRAKSETISDDWLKHILPLSPSPKLTDKGDCQEIDAAPPSTSRVSAWTAFQEPWREVIFNARQDSSEDSDDSDVDDPPGHVLHLRSQVARHLMNYKKRKDEGLEDKEDTEDLSGAKCWVDEEYEEARDVDKALERFKKTLQKNTRQVIRFSSCRINLTEAPSAEICSACHNGRLRPVAHTQPYLASVLQSVGAIVSADFLIAVFEECEGCSVPLIRVEQLVE